MLYSTKASIESVLMLAHCLSSNASQRYVCTKYDRDDYMTRARNTKLVGRKESFEHSDKY